MIDHDQPRPFVYALKQALRQPDLWKVRDRKVIRSGLGIAFTTEHEWTAQINGVDVKIIWLRVGDGFWDEDYTEMTLGLDQHLIRLTPYESDKLLNACEGLLRHFTKKEDRDRGNRLRLAMSKLEATLSKPRTEESSSHDQAVP